MPKLLILGPKKDALGRLDLCSWWRRGDLNPRPPVLHRRLYMFSFRQLI